MVIFPSYLKIPEGTHPASPPGAHGSAGFAGFPGKAVPRPPRQLASAVPGEAAAASSDSDLEQNVGKTLDMVWKSVHLLGDINCRNMNYSCVVFFLVFFLLIFFGRGERFTAICSIWGPQPVMLHAICTLLDLGLPFCILFAHFWNLNLSICMLFETFLDLNDSFRIDLGLV